MMSLLTGWESCYVITGAAAGALTGLTFVVITFIAQPRVGRLDQGVPAFSTPTVVHFCASLFMSAVLTAPWPALSLAALLLGLAGFAGLVYAGIIVWRLRRLTFYRPDWEDWLWFGIVPLAAYAALVVAAILLPSRPESTLFALGAITLVLLFLGIRNSWDTVTHVAAGHSQPDDQSSD
jgi:hypothetical protein